MLAMSFVCFLSKSQLSLAELVRATDSDSVLLCIILGDVLRLLCATRKEVCVYSCKAVQPIGYNNINS